MTVTAFARTAPGSLFRDAGIDLDDVDAERTPDRTALRSAFATVPLPPPELRHGDWLPPRTPHPGGGEADAAPG